MSLYYPTYSTKNRWRSVDTHFAMGIFTVYHDFIWQKISLTIFWQPFCLLLKPKEKGWRRSIVYRSRERENYRLIYERERRKTLCRLPKPEAKAEYQCRAHLLIMGPGEANGGRRGWWGQATLMGAGEANGAISHRPHARARQHHTPGQPPGQIPSQHLLHVLSPLSLHCSLIIHINTCFKTCYKVSGNCR